MQKFSSFLIVILISTTLNAQEIPNAGFETWEDEIGYQEPEYWQSINSVTAALGQVPVSADASDPYAGNYALKLETKSVFGLGLPGFVTLGAFEIDLLNRKYSLSGGVPYANRPGKFTGHFRYLPQGTDSCLVVAALFRNDGTQRDTVGGAFFSTKNTVEAWTEFSVDFEYFSEEKPDSLNIYIISSASEEASAGTKLFVDELQLTGSAAINTLFNEHYAVWYNNARSAIIIKNKTFSQEKTTAKLYSIDGRLLLSTIIPQGMTEYTIPCPKVDAGIYIICIQDRKNNYAHKLFISK